MLLTRIDDAGHGAHQFTTLDGEPFGAGLYADPDVAVAYARSRRWRIVTPPPPTYVTAEPEPASPLAAPQQEIDL